MKKFYFILASLCLVFAVSSCSADDLNDNSNLIDNTNLNNTLAPQIPIDNGDDDIDQDKDKE